MNRNELIQHFKSKGFHQSADETLIGTYATSLNLNSLASALSGNRLQAGWKKAQYIIAKYCPVDCSIDDLLEGWKVVVGNYRNQFLCMEIEPNDWKFYNSECEEIELEDIIGAATTASSSSILPYLTALRAKPFLLLAGISGTGKSRIVRKLAQATLPKALQEEWAGCTYTDGEWEEVRWGLQRPANFELIQVKPNWHNSMDVVGYQSNLPSPHYVFTPFVRFVVRACANPGVPFFLCLDEMNLAPVEEYFAEFLSAIESRSKSGGEYKTDPLIPPFKSFNEELADGGRSLCDKMVNELLPDFKASDTSTVLGQIAERLRKVGLTLPENLLVVGTVNMDETTFSFSRKVLDRAMSIEMNEVDYDSFLSGGTDDGLKSLAASCPDFGRLLVSRHVDAAEVVPGLGDDARRVVDYLKRVNCLLDGTPFKLGYRAANEALIYLESVRTFGAGDYSEAMDRFTLMKVLSRLEGDETKLKLTGSKSDSARLTKAGVDRVTAGQHGDMTLLTALRYIIVGELDTEELASVKKLDCMISQLSRDHFVSFWN